MQNDKRYILKQIYKFQKFIKKKNHGSEVK